MDPLRSERGVLGLTHSLPEGSRGLDHPPGVKRRHGFSPLLDQETKRTLGPVIDLEERLRHGPLLELEKRRAPDPSCCEKGGAGFVPSLSL